MKTYKIVIEETVSKVFEVDADSEEKALKIAKENYNNESFVLEPGSLIDVKFNLVLDD